MLTGSVAASYHGRPRATHDADLVIDPTPEQLECLLTSLQGADFYVDRDGAREAMRRRGQFNAIEMRYACKIVLIVRQDRPFSETEFGRRVAVDLTFGRNISIVTPEDAILSKLEWARKSGDSERQLADAVGVLDLNRSVDRRYIERWANELGVTDLWRRVSADVDAPASRRVLCGGLSSTCLRCLRGRLYNPVFGVGSRQAPDGLARPTEARGALSGSPRRSVTGACPP